MELEKFDDTGFVRNCGIYLTQPFANLFPAPDARVSNWFLMDSPVYLVAILSSYLLIIYRLAPAFMKNRKPYSLKRLLAVYNVVQVITCCYLISGALTVHPECIKIWECQHISYDNSYQSIAILTCFYHMFLLKLVELMETVFFVLRKKQNQVSNLHVYHHVSSALLGWLGVKYVGGGMSSFPMVINCGVHVIMYSYYFVALLGPNVQKKLVPIKKSITLIQMIQFSILLTQVYLGLSFGCEHPKILTILYTPNILLLFYMFYNFFKKMYNTKDASKNN